MSVSPLFVLTIGASWSQTKEMMRDHGLHGKKKVVIISSISAEQNLLATDTL